VFNKDKNYTGVRISNESDRNNDKRCSNVAIIVVKGNKNMNPIRHSSKKISSNSVTASKDNQTGSKSIDQILPYGSIKSYPTNYEDEN